MLFRILADLTLLLHLGFILFVLFGALLVLYRRWLAWVHIPMVMWGSVVNLASWVCPLTPLENDFRRAAGQAGYEGGFVEHYIAPVVYPEGMSYEMGVVVGVFAFVWNVVIYGIILYRLRRHTGGY